jgi:putative ABC transport system permease protein
MRFLDLLKLSTRMFRTRPSRTFLTILGMSVGIGAILFLVSLGYGLQKNLLERIATDEAILSLDVIPTKAELISLDKESLEEISQIPEVVEISPMVSFSAQMTIGELTADVLVYAIEPSWFRLGGISSKEGKVFSQENEIVVSSITAKLFDLEPEEIIGKKATFTFFLSKEEEKEGGEIEEIKIVKKEIPYQISGVIEDQEVNYVYLPLESLRDFPFSKYTQAKAKVSQNKFMEGVRDKIVQMGFQVAALSDTIEQANKIFRAIQIILAIFGLIALAVAAIGMFNTMTITLLERTNEIGVMKTIGASEKDIARLFLGESMIMGFLGGIGGVGVGFLGGAIFNFGINFLARALGGQSVDLFYHPIWFVITIVILSAIVGLLTGIFPARRAAKLNCLEALRYK